MSFSRSNSVIFSPATKLTRIVITGDSFLQWITINQSQIRPGNHGNLSKLFRPCSAPAILPRARLRYWPRKWDYKNLQKRRNCHSSVETIWLDIFHFIIFICPYQSSSTDPFPGRLNMLDNWLTSDLRDTDSHRDVQTGLEVCPDLKGWIFFPETLFWQP